MVAGDLCIVCYERERAGTLFCKTCGESYDRDANKDTSIAAVLKWAARRARMFERRRWRMKVCARCRWFEVIQINITPKGMACETVCTIDPLDPRGPRFYPRVTKEMSCPKFEGKR